MAIKGGLVMSEYTLTGIIVTCPDCKGFFLVRKVNGDIGYCSTCRGSGTVIQEIKEDNHE